jgi:glycine/D-amino acid oxidase-like deaminating enzyme
VSAQDAADPAGSLAALVADTAARRADGFDVEMLDPAQCDEILGLPSGRSGQYVGAQRFNYSATFHPGKYLFGLARGIGAKPGVSIYEQTRVSEIIEVPEGKVVATAGGHTVSAAYCLIATNALAPQFANGLARSLRAERGQVAVTEPLSVRPAHGCGGAAPPSAHLTGGRSMPPGAATACRSRLRDSL